MPNDSSEQNSGLVPKKLNNFKKITEVIGAEAVILLIVGLIIVLLLNYLSVIPLSKNYPAIFGFLPHRTLISSTNQSEKMNTSDLAKADSFLMCPVDSNCLGAKPVFDKSGNTILGVGYPQLSPKTHIIAVFDGKYKASRITREGVVLAEIELTDADGIRANYTFSGEALQSAGAIKKGDAIGTYNGGAFSVPETSQNYALFITLTDTNNQPIQIVPDKENGIRLY